MGVSSFSQMRVDVTAKPAMQQEEQDVAASERPAVSAAVIEAAACIVSAGEEAVLLPMLARSAVVLGYLFLDGEGTKADQGEACRLFRLAAACGSREGERVLGW